MKLYDLEPNNPLVERLRDAVNGEHDMTPRGADILQAIDRIEELEAQLAWQPIETAPRDGTQFLGWSKLHGVQSCLIQQSQAHYKRVEASYGGPQKRTWFCPTHWRPLPNGPKELEGLHDSKEMKYNGTH